MLEIIPPGSAVLVGHVEGVIVSVLIKASGVRYKVGYFIENEFMEVWFDESMVKFSDKRQSIGFQLG